MELTIWKGDYGLISMCPNCIRLALFVKLTKAPVTILYRSNPVGNAIGNYPIFRHEDITITDYDDCVSYLRINRYSTDFALSCKDCSLSYALTWLVMDKLAPALEYTRWLTEKNYNEFTFPWYKVVMPPIFNHWYAYRRRAQAKLYIETLFPELNSTEQYLHKYLLDATDECLAILSTRLAKSDYFFGATATSIDATVYAYLAPLLKIPLPCNEFGCLLMAYPTLCEFVKRIDNQFFAEVPNGAQYMMGAENEARRRHAKRFDDASCKDDGLSVKAKILVGVFVAGAMMSYAVSLNIINLSRFFHVSKV